jgi:hypothetical protein
MTDQRNRGEFDTARKHEIGQGEGADRTPKSRLAGTIVIAALVIAIILLATGVIQFGPR